jgi:hypothetical protein
MAAYALSGRAAPGLVGAPSNTNDHKEIVEDHLGR